MGFNSGLKGLIQHLVSSLSVSDRPVHRLRMLYNVYSARFQPCHLFTARNTAHDNKSRTREWGGAGWVGGNDYIQNSSSRQVSQNAGLATQITINQAR